MSPKTQSSLFENIGENEIDTLTDEDLLDEELKDPIPEVFEKETDY